MRELTRAILTREAPRLCAAGRRRRLRTGRFRATPAGLAALSLMTNRISLILGCLVGAAAIHATLVACTAGSSLSGVPGAESTARADPAAAPGAASAACTQWEIKTITPTKFGWTSVSYRDSAGANQSTSLPAIDAMTLEPGWEPIGALYYSPLVRRCIK